MLLFLLVQQVYLRSLGPGPRDERREPTTTAEGPAFGSRSSHSSREARTDCPLSPLDVEQKRAIEKRRTEKWERERASKKKEKEKKTRNNFQLSLLLGLQAQDGANEVGKKLNKGRKKTARADCAWCVGTGCLWIWDTKGRKGKKKAKQGKKGKVGFFSLFLFFF